MVFQNEIIGKGCKIIEPVYGTEFDLNKLRSDLYKNVTSVENEEDFIKFNVCGDSDIDCDGSNATACFTKDGKQLKFGKIRC